MKPVFKVGDKVIITKSKDNWGNSMDRYDGKIVEITKVTNNDNIRFKGDDGWSWNYSNGHFQPVDNPSTTDYEIY